MLSKSQNRNASQTRQEEARLLGAKYSYVALSTLAIQSIGNGLLTLLSNFSDNNAVPIRPGEARRKKTAPGVCFLCYFDGMGSF